MQVLDECMLIEPGGRIANLFQEYRTAVRLLGGQNSFVMIVRGNEFWDHQTDSEIAHLLDDCVRDGLPLSAATRQEHWM